MSHYSICYDGGLGDILFRMFENNGYMSLENLGANDTCDIHIVSHNPFSVELWDNHPKRSQLNLKVHPWREVEHNSQIRLWNNIPEDVMPAASQSKPELFPFDSDFEVLEELWGKKYMVMAASAGAGSRTFSPQVMAQVRDSILANGFIPVVIGRSYTRPGIRTLEDEKGFNSDPRVVSLIDKLSVPGTGLVLQHSAGVVVCHSAVCLMNWFIYRKPSLLIYPDDYARNVQEIYSLEPEKISLTVEEKYNFGRFFPETVTSFMSSYRDEVFQKFMSKVGQ